MQKGKTELILFLPIEQMYRFRSKTIDSNVAPAYQPLRNFIDQFNLHVSSIHSEKDFITVLTDSLNFSSDCYATSYSIKNHSGHYYGLFFITANLLGLEKIIEVKWQLDRQQGEGFTDDYQQDFLLELEKKSYLEEQLKIFIRQYKPTNIELYPKILSFGFLPKHANEIFRQWQTEGLLTVYDLKQNKPARKGSFKLSYKNSKNAEPQLQFRLN